MKNVILMDLVEYLFTEYSVKDKNFKITKTHRDLAFSWNQGIGFKIHITDSFKFNIMLNIDFQYRF